MSLEWLFARSLNSKPNSGHNLDPCQSTSRYTFIWSYGKLKILYALLSPTWALANLLKSRASNAEAKSYIVINLNGIYLCISIVSVFGVAVYQFISCNQPPSLYDSIPSIGVIIFWSYLLLSRCNEIFGAFLNDAFDKMEKSCGSTSLTPKQRIELSLKSYLELLLNFSLLYALTAPSLWKNCIAPMKISEAIYFSGVTITTTGYGDITPANWYPQFLSVYEVFCGMILLVVCFAIYAIRLDSRADCKNNNHTNSNP